MVDQVNRIRYAIALIGLSTSLAAFGCSAESGEEQDGELTEVTTQEAVTGSKTKVFLPKGDTCRESLAYLAVALNDASAEIWKQGTYEIRVKAIKPVTGDASNVRRYGVFVDGEDFQVGTTYFANDFKFSLASTDCKPTEIRQVTSVDRTQRTQQTKAKLPTNTPKIDLPKDDECASVLTSFAAGLAKASLGKKTAKGIAVTLTNENKDPLYPFTRDYLISIQGDGAADAISYDLTLNNDGAPCAFASLDRNAK